MFFVNTGVKFSADLRYIHSVSRVIFSIRNSKKQYYKQYHTYKDTWRTQIRSMQSRNNQPPPSMVASCCHSARKDSEG